MSVKILGLRTDTHGVNAEAHLLENFFRVQVLSLLIVAVEFFLTQLIEILHDGKVRGALGAVIGGIGNSEPGVQFGQQNLNGIDLCVVEILVGPEEIFEERNVLAQAGYFLESVRGSQIHFLCSVRPCFRLQRIDGVLTGHKVNIAAAQSLAQFLILTFGIKANNTLAGLPDVGQNQLEQIALALTGIAQDQDVGCGLIFRAAVEVHEDIGAILMSFDSSFPTRIVSSSL